MKITGQFESDFEFAKVRLHVGQQEEKEHVQISFPQLGDMNNNAEDVTITEDTVDCTFNINGFPCVIYLKEAEGGFTGTVSLEAVGFHKEVSYQKTSDEPGFAEHNYCIPEENLSKLRAHVEYDDTECENCMTYELNNTEVLAYVKSKGIDVENHHDFATICALMKKTCEVIHHDGANYHHDDDNYGTIAQMEYAAKQNNYTNCRGVGIILAGVLRAYGIPANVVECWPADTDSAEIHVVCEVYVKELGKTVLLDPSNNLIYYKDGEPISLFELRDALVKGETDGISLSEDSSHNGQELSLISLLGYMSKNLMYLRKAIHSDENSEIEKENVICLAPKGLVGKNMPSTVKMTCNIREFYPEIE